MSVVINLPPDHPAVIAAMREAAARQEKTARMSLLSRLGQANLKPIDHADFAADGAKVAELWRRQKIIAEAVAYLLEGD